ncbi:MAG: hypothetical protein QOC81_538 [Thermoanaerobaculia bacterium]|jgi:hypothetical protein|nr:hypothetical protein [Thermoanaerobaculia bacterium]
MKSRKSAVKWAGASALSVLLVSTSAFAAAPRHNRDQNGTDGQAAQTQVQTDQRGASRSGANRNGANDQRWNGQQQANVAPAAVQPAFDSRANTNAQRYDQNASRSGNQSWNNASQSRGQANTYRENQRVNVSGRVQSFHRERDGYRVYLDNGNYWIPVSQFGNRARDLRVGISLSFGGIFRGGVFGIDAVSWPSSGYGYDQGYVRGIVQQVDYRSDTMTLRDASTGRLFEVDMRSAGNARLGRGDYVTLSGQWVRGNVFAAYRVDSINRG